MGRARRKWLESFSLGAETGNFCNYDVIMTIFSEKTLSKLKKSHP